MADGIEFTVVVDREDLDKALAMMTPEGMDFPGMFAMMADDFYASEALIFASEGANRGGRWDPNSPGYAAIKKSNWGDVPVLQLTGALVRSMTMKGSTGGVLDIQPLEMTVGTSLPYADKHQRGSTEDMWVPYPYMMMMAGVPARPFLWFEEADRARWEKIANDWLTTIVAKMGS